MKFQKKLIALAVGSTQTLMAASLVAPALAQDNLALEEVIVTATRRATSIQDVPYNISALMGDTINKNGVTDLSDLTRLVPGIAFMDQGPRVTTNNYIILRGLNANSPDGASDIPNIAQPAVSMYFGNAPVFANFNLADLERVEVLRGPQGTLYGSGSLGGTLRFLPNKPDTEGTSGKVIAELSQTDESDDLNYKVDGVLNLPVGDNMAVRVAAGYRELAGFIDYEGLVAPDENGYPIPTGDFTFATRSLEDGNASDDWYARGSFLANIGESSSVLFTYQHQEGTADGRQAQSNTPSSGITDDYTLLQTYEEPMDSELDLAVLDVEVDLGFATLSSATSYSSQEIDWVRDSTAVYNNLFYWYQTYYYPYATNFTEGELEQEVVTQEFRLISNTEGSVDWVVGAYYTNQDLEFVEIQTMPGLMDYVNNDPFTFAAAPATTDVTYPAWRDVDFTDMALFGELTVHISDRWQVTGGVRAFDQDFEQTFIFKAPFCPSFYYAPATCGDPGGDGLTTTTNIDESISDQIFKVNTSFDITEDHKVYFTWAEGFRHGGANAVPTTGPYPEAVGVYETFDPDKATNWELGLKGMLMDGRFVYTLAGFYIDWEDAQFDGFTESAGFSAVLNGSNAVSQGLELELNGQLTENLSFTLGYNYTSSEWDEDGAIGGDPLFKGDRLPGVPEDIATGSLDYVYPIDMGLITFHLDGFYRSDVSVAPNPAWRDYEEIDSFSTFNTSLGLDTDDWSAKLFVNNLSNELATSGSVSEATALQYAYDFVARPRTVGLRFSYFFD
jgi:iron complex outermembrane receptor protein